MSTPVLVLMANVSEHERNLLASSLDRLGDAGIEHCAVRDPRHAHRVLTAHGASAVLVIDAGLLACPHNPEWLRFRELHPGVPAIVRSLYRGATSDRRTVYVHPDDEDGLHAALCRLRGDARDVSPRRRSAPLAAPSPLSDAPQRAPSEGMP